MRRGRRLGQRGRAARPALAVAKPRPSVEGMSFRSREIERERRLGDREASLEKDCSIVSQIGHRLKSNSRERDIRRAFKNDQYCLVVVG